MKEELYSWIKQLAFFYILLTTVLHLAPSEAYRKYIRFFMGLLLILMLTAPMFSILGKGEEILKDFDGFYGKEEAKRTLEEMESLQKTYLERGYEKALGDLLQKKLQEKGIETEGVRIYIEGEDIRAKLYVSRLPEEEKMEEIRDELMGEWGIGEGEYSVLASEDGEEAVDSAPASGPSAGSDRPSGVQ